MIMQSGFFYKDLEQVGVLLLVQKSVEDVWCQLYFVQVLRKEPLNIENRIGHAYPTSLYRLVYDRVAESHFVR
mgnify:CR=1 FL=1